MVKESTITPVVCANFILTRRADMGNTYANPGKKEERKNHAANPGLRWMLYDASTQPSIQDLGLGEYPSHELSGWTTDIVDSKTMGTVILAIISQGSFAVNEPC